MTTPSDRDPWADPATPTEPGAPYAGPPPTAPQPAPPAWGTPPGYGWAPGGYGPPGYPGYPGYPGGYPPPWPAWGYPPPRPRRPGQVIGAAVLAFVQAALALIGTMYTYMFAALVGLTSDLPGSSQPDVAGLAAEGEVLALVQLLSVVPLVVGGILVLTKRSRGAWLTLVVALALQVLITLYWVLRLSGGLGEGLGADETGPLIGFPFLFAAGPLVALGLLLVGAGRRWFTEPAED